MPASPHDGLFPLHSVPRERRSLLSGRHSVTRVLPVLCSPTLFVSSVRTDGGSSVRSVHGPCLAAVESPPHVSLASVRHTALSTCKGGCVPDILEKRVKPRAGRGSPEMEPVSHEQIASLGSQGCKWGRASPRRGWRLRIAAHGEHPLSSGDSPVPLTPSRQPRLWQYRRPRGFTQRFRAHPSSRMASSAGLGQTPFLLVATPGPKRIDLKCSHHQKKRGRGDTGDDGDV